eukprot:443741_1
MENQADKYHLHAKWIELTKCDAKYFSRPIMLNNNEFIVISDLMNESNFNNALFVYNISTNKWSIFFKFPKNEVYASYPSIAIDYNKQILYILDHYNMMIKIDIKTKQYTIISNI